jgi:hypothetical protein
MSLKSWIARNTQTPAQFASVYASHLPELSEYLAASLVAFSGKLTVEDEKESVPFAFLDHFEIVLSGFKPVVPSDAAQFIEPSAGTMAKEELFPAAFRDSVAFLSLIVDNSVRKHMQPNNAEIFIKTFHVSVAKACAGKYRMPSEPREGFMMIQQLIPTFLCKRMLNVNAYGSEDGLGNLLKHLSVSGSGKTRYAFVAGSDKQRLSCAGPYLNVLMKISESIEACAKDMRW